MDKTKGLQSEKSSPPTEMDDFKQVKGIGPAIEKRLHAAGITTYQQLAEQTPARLADLMKGLFGFTIEKITAQDWPSQAKELAGQYPEEEEYNPPVGDSLVNGRQHYEMFSVELLMDGKNHVQRTTVMYAQTREEQAWVGWDNQRLSDFIVTRAEMKLDEAASLEPAVSSISLAEEAQAAGVNNREKYITGSFRLLDTKQAAGEMSQNMTLLPAHRPFELSLDLDLGNVQSTRYPLLECHITLTAHNLGNGTEKVVGNYEGFAHPGERTTAQVIGDPMDSGIYRIDVAAILTPPDQAYQSDQRLRAWLESGLYEFS